MACEPPCLAVKAINTPITVNNDKRSANYCFDHPFVGVVRVTLRDTKPGETIFINGMRYVCNGTIDEQVMGRFVMQPWLSVTISGDRYFRNNHVQNVEGIELEAMPQPTHFLY